MRVIVATFAGLVALSAASAQAAPPVPKPPDISNQEWAPLSNNPPSLPPSAAPPVELAAQGCGWGWHHRHWRDRWGYWHWGAAFRMAGEPRDRDARAALTQKIWSTAAS